MFKSRSFYISTVWKVLNYFFFLYLIFHCLSFRKVYINKIYSINCHSNLFKISIYMFMFNFFKIHFFILYFVLYVCICKIWIQFSFYFINQSSNFSPHLYISHFISFKFWPVIIIRIILFNRIFTLFFYINPLFANVPFCDIFSNAFLLVNATFKYNIAVKIMKSHHYCMNVLNYHAILAKIFPIV